MIESDENDHDLADKLDQITRQTQTPNVSPTRGHPRTACIRHRTPPRAPIPGELLDARVRRAFASESVGQVLHPWAEVDEGADSMFANR